MATCRIYLNPNTKSLRYDRSNARQASLCSFLTVRGSNTHSADFTRSSLTGNPTLQRSDRRSADRYPHTDRTSLEGVIPGSLHIPRTVLEWCCDPLSAYRNPAIHGATQHLVLVCSEGYSSNLAAMSLRQLGFVNVVNLDGGYRGWKAYGLPTKAPDRPPEEELTGMTPPESMDGAALPIRCKRVSLRYWLYRVFLWVFR